MNREKQKWTRKKTTHDSYIRTPVSQPLYMHTNANVCPAFFRLISCSSCCLFLLPHFLFLLSFFSIILWVFSLPSWYFSFVKGAFVFDGCVSVCVCLFPRWWELSFMWRKNRNENSLMYTRRMRLLLLRWWWCIWRMGRSQQIKSRERTHCQLDS